MPPKKASPKIGRKFSDAERRVETSSIRSPAAMLPSYATVCRWPSLDRLQREHDEHLWPRANCGWPQRLDRGGSGRGCSGSYASLPPKRLLRARSGWQPRPDAKNRSRSAPGGVCAVSDLRSRRPLSEARERWVPGTALSLPLRSGSARAGADRRRSARPIAELRSAVCAQMPGFAAGSRAKRARGANSNSLVSDAAGRVSATSRRRLRRSGPRRPPTCGCR